MHLKVLNPFLRTAEDVALRLGLVIKLLVTRYWCNNE